MSAPTRRPDRLDGRAAAALAVADVLAGKQFVGEALRAFRQAGRLEPREAGLAMEIGLGTIRHLLTIERLVAALARFAPEQTKLLLRAVVYTAVYQIIWLERVPPFAAVDQAVELARRLTRGRTPGMANAVLRRVAGAIAARRTAWRRLDPAQVRVNWEQACQFDRPVFLALDVADMPARESAHSAEPGPPTDMLALATGERPERFAELTERLGAERAEAVAWASQAVPTTVVFRNVRRVAPDEFAAALRAGLGEHVGLSADGAAAFVPAGATLLELPAWQAGWLYVQDMSAHAAAAALQAQPGERILDLCAAPGGKSLALALAMEDRGELLACDTDAGRLERVHENAARLRLQSVGTKLLTGADADFTGIAPFDAVLVDVPCSNTGVIARRPEARLGLTPRKVRSLVALQSELLRRAARQVRPGGRVVYSTCSIEPQENEQVVTDFLDENAGWRLDAQALMLPAWGPQAADWRDGGYWARLVAK